MRLLGGFFNISDKRECNEGAVYAVRLNPEHFIYKAHFPGEAVTPGVCIMQMVLELLEDALGERLVLDTAKNVKFLQVIQPQEMPDISCAITKILKENNQVTAQACLSHGDTLLAKLSLACRTK